MDPQGNEWIAAVSNPFGLLSQPKACFCQICSLPPICLVSFMPFGDSLWPPSVPLPSSTTHTATGQRQCPSILKGGKSSRFASAAGWPAENATYLKGNQEPVCAGRKGFLGYEKLDDLSTSWRYSWDLHQELYQPVHQNHLTHPASRTARNNVCCWHPTWAWNASFLPTQLMTFHGAGRWPHDKITSNARTQPYYFHKPLNLDRVHHLSLASEASNSRNEDCWLHMQP